MILKSQRSAYWKSVAPGALLAAALAIPTPVSAQGYGGDAPPYGNQNTDTQSADQVQPVPDITPPIPKDLSMPADCKVIDDELARIEKFSHNPKATKTQLDANAARADKLTSNRKDLSCPAAAPAAAK